MKSLGIEIFGNFLRLGSSLTHTKIAIDRSRAQTIDPLQMLRCTYILEMFY